MTRADRTHRCWRVNNIEVIYDHVILVLKGVSLEVQRGQHRRAARSEWRRQDHHAQGDLQPARLRARRGDQGLDRIPRRAHRQAEPFRSWCKRGVVQVMEGRHCFQHLTVRGKPADRRVHAQRQPRCRSARDLEMVYDYFPRLKQRRKSQAGYTSGGEQQMTAIGRALMARPSMILLDEPSMGLAPQVVEEIFEIVRSTEREGKRQLPAGRAEYRRRAALRRLRLHSRKRPRGDGRARAADSRSNEDVKEFYLGLSAAGARAIRDAKHYRRRKRWLA